MKNSLKLIIESIRVAMDKVIDKISWANLKDKPFYESTQDVILVDSLTSESYGNEDVENPKCNFVPDATYKVIWNVEVYDNLVCYFDGEYNIIASNDNGCPFYIDDDGGNGLYIESDNEDELWTVSIIEYKKELHKIDEKYLPNMGVRSWNDLEDKPFGEEQTITNIEGLEYRVCPRIENNGTNFPHDFIIPLEVGQKYNIYYHDHDVLYGTCEVKMDADGICYLGTSDYSDYPFYITPTVTRLSYAWVNAMRPTSLKIVGVSGVITGESKIHHIDPKYIKDMYYEKDSSIFLPIISSEGVGFAGGFTDYKIKIPYVLERDKPISLRVDGVVYEFDSFVDDGEFKALGSVIYRIGAPYSAYNGQMDSSEYPFTIIIFYDNFAGYRDEEYANIEFADGTPNHTVEILGEIEIKHIDPKFIKDMYYEEKDYTAVLSYAPSTYSDDILSYNCTADEIASFRELLDNNSEITVGIGETLYTLEFRGMSSGYYELYYNDSLVFEYYMGNANRQIKFYYKNLGLSSTPEGIEITFYKQDTLVHKIDEKYIPDTIARKEYVDTAVANAGGNVQADWNQNDETASDYVKNRTHYIEESDLVVFNETVAFDENGVYTFSESIPLTSGGYYNIQLGDNVYSGTVMNFKGNKLYFTTSNSVKNYFDNTTIYIQEFANKTIALKITKLGTNVIIDEKFLPSNVAKTDNIPVKLTDIKTTSKPYFILASTTENSTKNFKITVDDTGTLTVEEHCELYSAAFTKASVRYTNQATLNVETSANVKEIVLVNEKGSVMTAATTSEIDTDGNKVWTLKFNPGNVGVRTFTVYGVTENNLETERVDVFIYATYR